MDKIRISATLDLKKKQVSVLAELMKESRTILVASTHSLPSSQFNEIKKKLRGKADLRVAKKSIIIKAIESTEKGALQNLKNYITADTVIFFSGLDAFDLSALLSENYGPAKAKPMDIAPEDISIDPGLTDLLPGPAISELSSVGLKVVVESGKLAIKQGAVIVKKGVPIKENVAAVLSKLNILPMKVGFISIAAYDAVSDKVYSPIKIDKKAALEELKTSISKALGFAVNIEYICKETVKYFIRKVILEEKAIIKISQAQKNNKEDK